MSLQQLIKRSSAHYAQAHHHHARFLQRHGWEIAAGYGDVAVEKKAIEKSIALVDVSWLGKLECKGDWVAALQAGLIPDAVFYRLIPLHGIWIVPPQSVAFAQVTLESRLGRQPRSYLINTSSLHASFELLGPRAEDALCKLSGVHVPSAGHTQAPVAGVHCLVVRHTHGFQFHFGREYGEYLWECFLDAGAEFGICPVGLEAIGV